MIQNKYLFSLFPSRPRSLSSRAAGLIFAVCIGIAGSAHAQEEPPVSTSYDPMVTTEEGQVGYDEPTDEGYNVVSDSDHGQTVGHWGLQVAGVGQAAALIGNAVSVPFLGVRKWYEEGKGFEAGVALGFDLDGQADTSTISFGVTGGWMRAISIHKHLAIFWEPQVTMFLVVPDDDTGFETEFSLDGRMNIGGEFRLGFIGLPEVGLTTKLSAGLQISHNGETDFFLGTLGGQANSLRGLFESTIGFVLYL